MSLVLFRDVISKFWKEEITQEALMFLIGMEMVSTNIRIWRDFIISRDSGLVAKDAIDYQERPAQKRKNTPVEFK